MKVISALALALFLLPIESNATSVCMLYGYIAKFRGTCTTATFLGKDRLSSCQSSKYSNVTFGLMRKGSGLVTFYLEGVGVMLFSGPEKLTPPQLENYRLVLNRVELPDHKTAPKGRQVARGECSIQKNSQGAFTISCDATIPAGRIEFSMTSAEVTEIEDCKEYDGVE
jgi:hypothetical protein